MRASTLLSRLVLLPLALATTADTGADTNSNSNSATPQAPLAPASKTHKISIWTQPLPEVPNLPRYEKLAKIIYTYPSLNSSVDYYDIPSFLTPEAEGAPAPLADDALVKLGFYAGRIGDEEAWRGVVVAAGVFRAGRRKTLRMFLDEAGKVWHVGFASVPEVVEEVGKGGGGKKGENGGAQKTGSDTLRIELVPVNRGSQPHLNKPVVINKEGKPEGEEEEQKTFLQKYWWAILLFLVIQVAMGGGGDK